MEGSNNSALVAEGMVGQNIWHRLGGRWVNSVLQLIVTQLHYNPKRPYAPPNDETLRGTGFVIDAAQGLVVTNAHVAMGALAITGRVTRFGKRDFTLKLRSICLEKDLALVQLIPEDLAIFIQGYQDPSELNMVFGDNMDLHQGQEVMTIGYPLGEGEVKYTTGIISGFKSNIDDLTKFDGGNEEDARSRESTFIQITAALNPGNSGGPLIDGSGKVIGICSSGFSQAQSIGFAIGSRTLLSILCQMKKSLVVDVPTFGFGWSNSTRELMVNRCGAAKIHGIYIRRVDPDSCFSNLQVGDIITHLFYDDPFWAMKRTTKDRSQLLLSDDCSSKQCLFVCGYFDRFGDLVLHEADRNNKGAFEPTPKNPDLFLSTRKLSLAEVTDMIPIGARVQLQICRDRQWYRLESQYLPKGKVGRIPYLIGRCQPFDYEMFAGICCTPITQNLIESIGELANSLRGSEKRYGNCLVINQVFPGTSVAKASSFQEGEILEAINDKPIRTLEELRIILREIVQGTNPIFTIQSRNGSLFLGSIDSLRLEDQVAIDAFGVDPEKALFGESLPIDERKIS